MMREKVPYAKIIIVKILVVVDDEWMNETYRPGELERQTDSVSTDGRVVGARAVEAGRVITEDGREEITVGARTRQIDARLVVLQTDAELSTARFTAPSGWEIVVVVVGWCRRCFESTAAVAFGIAAQLVEEAIKAQFKHAGTTHCSRRQHHQHEQDQEARWRCHFSPFFRLRLDWRCANNLATHAVEWKTTQSKCCVTLDNPSSAAEKWKTGQKRLKQYWRAFLKMRPLRTEFGVRLVVERVLAVGYTVRLMLDASTRAALLDRQVEEVLKVPPLHYYPLLGSMKKKNQRRKWLKQNRKLACWLLLLLLPSRFFSFFSVRPYTSTGGKNNKSIIGDFDQWYNRNELKCISSNSILERISPELVKGITINQVNGVNKSIMKSLKYLNTR